MKRSEKAASLPQKASLGHSHLSCLDWKKATLKATSE